MDLEKSISFIKENGNEVEQARLKYVLSDERPSKEIVTKLFAGQRPDGGWSPFWAEDYSSVDATCFRLAQAEQLGIMESEHPVKQAVDFLSQRQSVDGSWEEEMNVVDMAPPWAKPGEVSAKLYLTANCGLWLALLGNPDNRASKAAEFIEVHLGQDGGLPSFLHTYWLAGGLFHKLNRSASTVMLAYLNGRINGFSSSNLAWLITTLGAAGVSPQHPLLEKASSVLEQNQKDDGSWESEDGADQAVHVTVETIRALSFCGRLYN
jgi:hypothetical protein